MRHLETIDSSLLVNTVGGQAQQAPQQDQPTDEGPPRRTWSQVGRDYAAACVQGAGSSLIYGGRPRSVREGLTNAAMGCAMGMGMRGVEDLSGALSGGG
jgi:hypothetical protein